MHTCIYSWTDHKHKFTKILSWPICLSPCLPWSLTYISMHRNPHVTPVSMSSRVQYQKWSLWFLIGHYRLSRSQESYTSECLQLYVLWLLIGMLSFSSHCSWSFLISLCHGSFVWRLDIFGVMLWTDANVLFYFHKSYVDLMVRCGLWPLLYVTTWVNG